MCVSGFLKSFRFVVLLCESLYLVWKLSSHCVEQTVKASLSLHCLSALELRPCSLRRWVTSCFSTMGPMGLTRDKTSLQHLKYKYIYNTCKHTSQIVKRKVVKTSHLTPMCRDFSERRVKSLRDKPDTNQQKLIWVLTDGQPYEENAVENFTLLQSKLLLPGTNWEFQ